MPFRAAHTGIGAIVSGFPSDLEPRLVNAVWQA